jgi:hypothetical protein
VRNAEVVDYVWRTDALPAEVFPDAPHQITTAPVMLLVNRRCGFALQLRPLLNREAFLQGWTLVPIFVLYFVHFVL